MPSSRLVVWCQPSECRSADVHQLLRCAVGLGGVEGEVAVEVEDAGYGLRQLADGDVLAGADVDQRRCVFGEQGDEAGVVRFIRKQQAWPRSSE